MNIFKIHLILHSPGPVPPVFASYEYPTLPITKNREKVQSIHYSICNSVYMCEMMPTVWLMTALLVDPQVLRFCPLLVWMWHCVLELPLMSIFA